MWKRQEGPRPAGLRLQLFVLRAGGASPGFEPGPELIDHPLGIRLSCLAMSPLVFSCICHLHLEF